MPIRNLQITIVEQPTGTPRRRGRSGARGHDDPGSSYVLPDPDDPEGSYVLPDPDDPEGSYVLPDPDDPTGEGRFAHALPAAAHAVVSARYLPHGAGEARPCCCTPCADQTPRTPERPCITAGDYSGFVIVRLARGIGPLTVESLWELASRPELAGLREVLALPLGEEEVPDESDEPGSASPPEPPRVLVSRPLIQLRCRNRAAAVGILQGLEDQAARTRFRPRHGLARYWRVDLRPYPELVTEVLDRFNDLAEVDLAYRELRALDTAAWESAATTGDLADDQGYFDPAPAGIGAHGVMEHIASEVAKAAKAVRPELTVVDLEQGWIVEHHDLAAHVNLPDVLLHGENREEDEAGSGHHGTAVLGQLAAAGQGALQVRGSAAGFARFRLASHYRAQDEPSRENPFPGTNGHVASAIVNCLVDPGSPAPLGTGDILLLEVQRGRLPTETDEADFDAIRLATALGVIVVEAAGNGNHDLDRCDDPQTGRTLRRGAAGFADSGAILVGAAFSELPHDRAPFSNYGSRVDCYGWGEGVTTCGYGDLHEGSGSPEEFYTNTFNGTSSAAPIIAGAAALVQYLHLLQTGNPLPPLPMRALLGSRATGTPQGPNVAGNIGVMPNLSVIVREALQLVPDVYARRHLCDDGSRPGAGDPLASSPDLVVLAQALGDPAKELGEGSQSAHHPAPGEMPSQGGSVYVRLRNRGRGAPSPEVLLYASPAATWISPEAWTHVGTASFQAVGSGDTFHVSAPVDWKPGGFGGAQPSWPQGVVQGYSFLAVFDREGKARPDPARALPPAMPYFSWRSHRRFLRGPGVAWRNVHPVAPGTEPSLAFFLAGTPDRGRDFDLEVIQRLPDGASVVLHLPHALAAKLRQRQPGLGVDDPGALALPRRRGVRFGRVRLPAGLRAPAWFHVRASGAPLAEGHSLTLRQIWQGEEVGRITWYVTDGGA